MKIIPLLQSLEAMLNDRSILYEVRTCNIVLYYESTIIELGFEFYIQKIVLFLGLNLGTTVISISYYNKQHNNKN